MVMFLMTRIRAAKVVRITVLEESSVREQRLLKHENGLKKRVRDGQQIEKETKMMILRSKEMPPQKLGKVQMELREERESKKVSLPKERPVMTKEGYSGKFLSLFSD